MRFIPVTIENIEDLYHLNKQLAIEEGQEDLFTARLEDYTQGFVGVSSNAFGTLCMHNNHFAGFAIWYFTFATYLGFKTLYIEDIYLHKAVCTDENKAAFLQHLIEEAWKNQCIRVEMRVLHNCNWGIECLKEFGFREVKKWTVYRLLKREKG